MDLITARSEVQRQLADIGTVDILVGIPSFNNARTIGHVVRAVQAGLAKYFPEQKCVLVNSDGGSTDGTMDVVQRSSIEDMRSVLFHHRVEPVFKITAPYIGIPGKGSAFRAIFGTAAALEAKACAVVDADLRSITPEWVELLVKPVLKDGFDFVAPLYHRHKYDGTITNSIIYPLTRALYGRQVRQPIGGDFGLSGRMAEFYLSKDVWETDIARYGIDIWMTTEALANGYKVAQSFLGAKIHDPKDPGSDLSAMLAQVTGTAFGLMDAYEAVWRSVDGSERVPTYGFQYTVGLEHVTVNVERMMGIFRTGLKDLRNIWLVVIGAGDLHELEQHAGAAGGAFRFPPGLWARIVYDYALAYHKRKLPREHLLRSFLPLYLGRTASFVGETAEAGQDEAEAVIEDLCLHFEKEKTYVKNNWNVTEV